MLGIRGVRRGITYMTASGSAMARTSIFWTELVFQPEMSPLNEDAAKENMYCSNTRCMSAGARAEWACEHVLRLPHHLSNPSPPPPGKC